MSSTPIWGLPQDPRRLMKWVELNALPVSRWAAALGARKACQRCGAGIIDLLRFAEEIAELYEMTKREREEFHSHLVFVLKDSGLEVGVWSVPTVCSLCMNEGRNIDPAVSIDEESSTNDWAINWLEVMEARPREGVLHENLHGITPTEPDHNTPIDWVKIAWAIPEGDPDEMVVTAAGVGLLHVALRVTIPNVVALVVLTFPFGQRQLELGVSASEVDAQRDHRVALLADLSDETFDLSALEQQLPVALRVVIHELARMGVGRDVHPDQVDLTVTYAGVGVLEGDLAVTQALDLCSAQHHSHLHRLVDVVVETRLPIGRDELGPLREVTALLLLFAAFTHTATVALAFAGFARKKAACMLRDYEQAQGSSGGRNRTGGSAVSQCARRSPHLRDHAPGG